MKTLDCESVDSTYESLKQILGISRSNLESLFDEIAITRLEDSDAASRISPEDYVLTGVQQISRTQSEYDQTCWFHLTRVSEPSRFENGLLPLPQVIESI